MTTVNIQTTDHHNCYVQDEVTFRPCSTFFLLDPSTGDVCADYQLDNTMSAKTFHGTNREYGVSPYFSAEILNSVMMELKPLLQKVVDNYYEIVNYQGNVEGRLHYEGRQAELEIQQFLHNVEVKIDETNLVQVYGAGDWFETSIDEIVSRMKKGEDVEEFIDEYTKPNFGELVLVGVEEYTEHLKDQLKEGLL